jgi:hypothetical protein
MFERGRVDNLAEQSAVPVEIAFADGTAAKGKMLVPAGKSVADALNGTGSFVEFEPYGGDKSYLAKAQLASVRLVGVPKAPNLQARLIDVDGFDPHRILGLSVGAGREEVRAAYFALAKAYHPDRYATAELPAEVRAYLGAMARRINAAHAALEAPQKRQAARAEPVFTSPGR